jgi:hypothetical protein
MGGGSGIHLHHLRSVRATASAAHRRHCVASSSIKSQTTNSAAIMFSVLANIFLLYQDHEVICFHKALPPFKLARMDWRQHPILQKRRSVPPPQLPPLTASADVATMQGLAHSHYIDPDRKSGHENHHRAPPIRATTPPLTPYTWVMRMRSSLYIPFWPFSKEMRALLPYMHASFLFEPVRLCLLAYNRLAVSLAVSPARYEVLLNGHRQLLTHHALPITANHALDYGLGEHSPSAPRSEEWRCVCPLLSCSRWEGNRSGSSAAWDRRRITARAQGFRDASFGGETSAHHSQHRHIGWEP